MSKSLMDGIRNNKIISSFNFTWRGARDYRADDWSSDEDGWVAKRDEARLLGERDRRRPRGVVERSC